MTQKSAGIYERKGSLYLIASLQTDSGLWIKSGPCTVLETATSAAVLGEAILEALGRSGAIIPHPSDWKSVVDDSPVLQAAGVKSWRTFRKRARYLSIALYDEFMLTPTANQGSQGFAHQPDAMLSLPPSATADELGEAVKRAFASCT